MELSYDRKFEEMKKYIPFLESMINRLENKSGSTTKNPRQAQLDKIRSLRDLLLNKNKRMKMDNLLKCEQVLVNLYTKVEQRDTIPATPQVIEEKSTSSKDKSDLEIVRNKLKTVAKIQDGIETLPEIARANDIEFNYTGSKEPALFQRRPKKSTISPVRAEQTSPGDVKKVSPQSQSRRNYSRVLISPDQSPSRWCNPENSSDKPLFSRRSPPKTITPQPVGKKEKKKSKASKSRKTNDLNITLNVPQESLHSLNPEDILPRIINCNDGDVDIDTLRELRTQILGELKQTGKNDDISDLILKSYNIKSKPKKIITGKNSKADVEEGELSDSESEAIESIYGNLPTNDKEKKSSALLIPKENKEQRKIQICLVIDKVASAKSSKITEPSEVIDLESELEMCSESENDRHIISVDSDTSLSSPKKKYVAEKPIENSKAKKMVGIDPLNKTNSEKVTECITLEDDNQIIEVLSNEETDESESRAIEKNNIKKSNENNDSTVSNPIATAESPKNIMNDIKTNTKDIDNNENSDQAQKTADQEPKFVANFYKPIEEERCDLSSSCSITTSLQEKEHLHVKNNLTESVRLECANASDVTSNQEKQNDDINKSIVPVNTVNKTPETDTCGAEDKQEDSQNIPLLNEPAVPPKAKADVLSQIDILQALKNEILSGSISVPGTEVATPALHQPKLTKVANALEVMPKKKISIEKYKEKVSTSTANSLFFKKRSLASRIKDELNRKQSLKLTEKECERFNFPKRLSFDDDNDFDNLSDDDFLAEGKDDSLGLDDIYGDLAPKSPDNDSLNKSTTPPVIIPTDPKVFEASVVQNKGDVDMRTALSTPLQPSPVPQPAPPPLISSVGFGSIQASPAYGIDINMSQIHTDSSKTVADNNRISSLDPRKRRDLSLSVMNSPNPYTSAMPERTPRSFSNVVASTPNMTPSMTPNMTPSYMPSIPQLRTPNARTFEMTPSHQTFELEEPTTRKHVYAPSFPMCDSREKESSVSKDGPIWEMNKNDPRSRRNRWEDSNKHTGGPIWEDRDPWNSSGQSDGSHTPRYEDSYPSKYDNRVRGDKYMTYNRRDSYNKTDCPTTPIPSFGWSECPSTPSSAFGRQEAPMTPSHPFGRLECPTTPVHAFGRVDCPSTPSSGFGRNVDMTSNHSYNRSDCPTTPSHPFGGNECPRTPSHPFGRSDSVPYNRPDISNNSNQKYSKDPRLNRRPAEHGTSSYNERENYKSDRDRKISSYKSQSKHFDTTDKSRNYERERSIGRNDREKDDRYAQQYDRNRREVSLAPSTSAENNRLYSRNRESRYDSRFSKDYNDLQNNRERSVGVTSDSKHCIERGRSRSRALSVGRSSSKELNKDKILLQSETGKIFTINTSIKSTFQDFLPSGKPMKVFEYSLDNRRQRAASVGRSLLPKSSVDRTPSTLPKDSYSTYAQDRNSKFKRASSVGRELTNTVRTFQEVKADFEAFRSKHTIYKVDDEKEPKKYDTRQNKPFMRKETLNQEQKTNQSKQNYSPRKNTRDPRMRKDSIDSKSRYKIDRRYDSRDTRKSGIIYSNDNIAKGTIMGSGFGVKNYKIPKLKRIEPEVPEPKTVGKENAESVQKDDIKKRSEESDKKTKEKVSKQSAKLDEETSLKTNNKNENENKTARNIVEENETRESRSKKKTDSNNLERDVDDVVVKTRKFKKPVIYDSDSDSVPEKEVTKKCIPITSSKLNSPSKKANNSKNIVSPVTATESQKDVIEEFSQDSSFGLDDIGIFSENLESDSQIDNMQLSDLIANLDKDLITSKASNDTFCTNIDNMMKTINSPEGNSLGDTSEMIQKASNKSNELQQDLTADNQAHEKKQVVLDITKQRKSSLSNNSDINIPQNANQVIETTKHRDIEQSTTQPEALVNESNKAKKVLKIIDVAKHVDTEQPTSRPEALDIKPNKHIELLEDTILAKVNEAIVSTTEIDRKTNEDIIQTGLESNANSLEQSTPDSTVNKSIFTKTSDGIPDSTNEIHCDLSSDVTSTNDASEKESEMQSSSKKENMNSMENLLSILQNRSKIKELLSMLGDQCSDNEKIKKKLEKLSEIVSDEEDEVIKKSDSEHTLHDTTVESEKTNLESSVINISEKIKQNEYEQKIQLQKSDGSSLTPNLKKKSETEIITNVENNEDKFSKIEDFNTTDDKRNKNESDSLSNIEDTNTDETKSINKLSGGGTDGTDKLDNEDDEDDEPLVNKVTKKIKSDEKGTKKTRNVKTKTVPNKIIKKRTTRAMPAKVGVKKRGELQKLQEDIKEMFMCDDILNATGIRMCRLAKMASEIPNVDSGPIVVLEKVKEAKSHDQPIKIRKKPGPKPKIKPIKSNSKFPESDTKMNKPKAVSKYKPGPKSKTKSTNDDIDPYEFDTDSVADTNTTKDSDDNSSDSENESLESSVSFGSSEMLNMKKKPKRKRRGIGGWQSGVIKPKNRKKKEQKQEAPKNGSPVIKPQKHITIPDLNCFTDKSYCFQKDVFTYDCRLCVYSGSDIINHYKKQHPHTEIPLSRMDQKTAELAIQQCEHKNFQSLSKISSEKYTCRFCYKEFGSNRNVLETFFWHIVSNHTGEFKKICSECINVTRCPFNLDIPPPPKDGGQLIGYICQKCHFTQISLENLKTHVHVRHNDEETEVFTINLAVMSNKAMNTMLRRAEAQKPRVVRSLRSNQTVTDSSDVRDDCSNDSDSSGHNSECNQSEPISNNCEQKEVEVVEQKPKIEQMKAKLTFENDEPSDDAVVKIELDNRDDTSHLGDTLNETTEKKDSRRGNSDEIVDYPHFKLNYTESGAKEYVCCINGNDSHYKTSLLISMKKHIQTKHSEKWDGYCSMCKVIVTLQGVQSDFRDCLSHFLDKHMVDFPVLEKVVECAREEAETTSLAESNTSATITDVVISALSTPVLSAIPPALSPALPARVATPPVERTASPSYIAVRPLSELIARDLMNEIEPPQETPITLPKIEVVVSLGEDTVTPAQPSPLYPINSDPAPLPDKPFLYEEVQAEVMSKKHRVVLDTMMTRENLVRVFKCAGRFCSFTTDSPDEALLHASTHRRLGGEGALSCAYCNYDACDNPIDMVMHVFKEHSRCQYCCPMCFYRAAASQLVGKHFAKAHGDVTKLKNVLRSTAAVPPPTPGHSAGLLTRDIAVQHFVCNHDEGACNFKTYTPGKFIEHLQVRHTTATSHPCNLCSSAAASPAELVLHLRSHGLKLYQCTWCVHGANNESELLSHAATRHPESQPQAYVRVITNKEGGKRVLPLAYLNKLKVPTEDVAPSTIHENPIREAERSIELEKLIAHTMMFNSDSATSQSAPNADDVSPEEPIELPVESLSDDHDSDEPLTEELALPAADQSVPKDITEQNREKDDTPTQNESSVVKIEPDSAPKGFMSDDIICLDSDDESDATSVQAPVTSTDEASSNASEIVAQKISNEVPRNSVTDEVSITKVTEEPTNTVVGANQNESIIDLSDDDPTAPPETQPNMIVNKNCIFKCPGCLKISKSMFALKKHVKKQCFFRVGPTPKCPHLPCKFRANDFKTLMAHYSTVHSGVVKKSMICGICSHHFPSSTGAKLHIRSIHKVNNYEVTSKPDGNGGFVYTIKDAGETEPVRISGRKTSTEIQRYQAEPVGRKQRKTSIEVKKRYGIADIDKLPINPILDSEVYCDLCEFGSKVRLNMVRHLQQHAGNVPVPHTAPVNPVPHLETNEMYFDRMVNLASSSVASRAPDKPRAEEPTVALKVSAAESSRYPKYVAERVRYTCGATDCSYISVDMAMFRCHWETLHATEAQYRCVHCPPTQALTTSIELTAARILGHLRMHDVSLYACSVCSYYHYRRHLVEKHIAELHTDGSVKVVREEYQTEPATPPPAAAPTMDLKAWQCGLCNFSSMLRPKVVNHCGTEHQSKMQFKCGHCNFRSSAKENVVKHQTNAHPAMPEEVFYYFYREGSLPEEGGVPRWHLQRQKLRLDERDVKTEPAPESVPETPKTPISIPSAPIVDLNIVKEEKPEEPSPATQLSLEELCKKFGPLCEPDGIKYKCSLCKSVKEHSRDTMQCHLFEELNYRRWECVICCYKAFHKNGLSDHMASEHSRQFNPPRALPVDVNIEKWVQNVLDHQTKIIERNLSNLSTQKIQTERTTVLASPKKPESPKPVSDVSDRELQKAFGEFGAPKNQQFACPKCEFRTKDEAIMVTHLESELTRIRWGCSKCSIKYQTFHEAQFHCKSDHPGQPAQPESIRDPSLRHGWVKAVVSSQKQFIKCISETNREPTPEKNSEDSDQSENSLLVAMYDEPVHIDERLAAKRPAPSADSDDEKLVIDEPQSKKPNDRTCPYCDYNIRNSRYLREHILKEHYNMKPYICCYCPFEGTRQAVTSHCNAQHYDQPKRLIVVQVPTTLPTDGSTRIYEPIGTTSSHDTDKDTAAAVAKLSKRESKDDEKKVCLYCEKSVPESETESHTHGTEKAEFAKRGEVVVKCCKCLVLRLSISSLEEHFNACHPGDNVLDNYAYFRLQLDTREIHCCGHCYKKFKFLRDLKVHHSTSHTSLSLSYTSIPFSHNLHTEGDSDIGKRKAEDTAGPPTKRVARKSTSKLPNSAVARKSTTKLPYTRPDLEESSSYGKKPLPLEHYEDVTLTMPMYNTMVEVDVKKLKGLLKIDPKVVIEDYRSSQNQTRNLTDWHDDSSSETVS